MGLMDYPNPDGSDTWVDESGQVAADQSVWPDASAGGGFWDGFGKVAESFLTTGIPRIIDAKAGLVRAENSMPVVYRNGRPYPIDPDAYRYGGYGGLSGVGMSGNTMMLLGLGAVALVLMLKD